MSKRELIPRIARWWLRIQDYELEIIHRQGRLMEHVDALSRNPSEPSKESDVATLRVDKVTIDREDWLFAMQTQDEKLKYILQKLNEGDKLLKKDYVNENGRLFRKVNDKKLWVVPKPLRWKVLEENHDKNGHLGVVKTIDRIKSYAWFPRMKNFVKGYVNTCVECAYNKCRGGKTEGQFHYDNMEPRPVTTLHLDHLGPFPKSSKRNEHILIIVDAFTKYTMLKAVKSTATKFVLKALDEWVNIFGVPRRVITDRATGFTVKEFQKFCLENDIKHITNATRTPRANGHAKRHNRTLKSMLTTTTSQDKVWDQKLTKLQWSLNTMRNATTKKTPHELLFSFTPRDTLHNKILLSLDGEEEITEDQLDDRRKKAAERVNQQRAQEKLRFDRRRRHPTIYREGDLVLAENEPAATGTSRKLEPKFKGPFVVKRSLGKDRYLITDLPQTKRTNRQYTSVFASDRLKPWCALPDVDDESDSDVGTETDSEVTAPGRMAEL